MTVLKTIFLIVYLLIAVALIIISFSQTKQDNGASAAIMAGSKDSFYEKNKNRSKEARMNMTIVGLFVLFVLGNLTLYLIP